jgi:hypothetical protein
MLKRGTTRASLFFIIFANTLSASIEDLRLTQYRYEANGHLQGQCFEIDRRTQGKEFKVQKSDYFCEGLFENKTTYLIPNKKGLGGDCYEVDAQTKGSQFSQRKPYSFCRPQKTHFEWIENRCYEKGLRDDGHLFQQRVVSEKCLDRISTQLLWFANKSGLSGNCYKVDSATMGKVVKELASPTDCQPEETLTVWLQDKNNPSHGRCYILDAQKGPVGYVATTSDSDCLDKKNEFSWLQKNEFEGDCYELNKTNTGESVPKKVPAAQCVPSDVEYFFLRESPTKGNCLQRDLKTQGKSFQQKVNIRLCRPKEVISTWVETPGDLRGGECLIVDKKTQGMNYIESRPKEECLHSTGQHQFELNTKRLEGNCFEVIPLGSKIQRKRVPIDRCKPKEVKLAWNGDEKTLEGHCYEIDKVHGAHGFLKRIAPLHCKPYYLEDVEYIFHRAAEAESGRCLEVDKETQGRKYAVKAPEEKCRKQLSLPDVAN